MALIIVVITVAVVVTTLLLVPVRVDLFAGKPAEDAVRLRVRVRWLGFNFPGHRAVGAKKKRPPRKRRKSGGRLRLGNVLRALRSPGLATRVLRLLSDLIRLARPYRLRVRGRLGFDDPSETGMLLGWVYGFRRRPDSQSRWSVRIDPDFTREVAEGSLSVSWSRSPGALLWPVVKFSLSPSVWRAARVALRRAS